MSTILHFLIISLLSIQSIITHQYDQYNRDDVYGGDFYTNALARLIGQHLTILNDGKANKRACIRRNKNCNTRPDDCCNGSSCKCSVFTGDCRCLRIGLFQKLYS